MKPSPRDKKAKASSLTEHTADEQGQGQQSANQEKSKRIRTKPKDIHPNQLDSIKSSIAKSFSFAGVENIKRFEVIREVNPDTSILFNTSTASIGEIDDPYDDTIERLTMEENMRALMNLMRENEERSAQAAAESRRTQATMENAIQALTQLVLQGQQAQQQMQPNPQQAGQQAAPPLVQQMAGPAAAALPAPAAEDWDAMWHEIIRHSTRGKNFTPRDKNEVYKLEEDMEERNETPANTSNTNKKAIKLYYWVALHGWTIALQIKKANKQQEDGVPLPTMPVIQQPYVAPRPRPIFGYGGAVQAPRHAYYQQPAYQQAYQPGQYQLPAAPRAPRGRGRGRARY